MELKQALTILRDLFMPQPRNACPHCGGIRCIGACQFNEKQPVESGSSKDDQARQGSAPNNWASPHADGQGVEKKTNGCTAGQVAVTDKNREQK